MIKNSYIVLSMLALLSCGTTKQSGTKQMSEDEKRVEAMKSQDATYSLEKFNSGKELYNANCNLCHELPNPTHESVSEWKSIMPKMAQLVNKKKPNTIDAAKEDLMLKYVIAMQQK